MKILDIPRSGSYQSITSSHNRAGQYVRNRRSPTQTPTTRRTLMRSAFGSASAGYSSLTSSQMAAWAGAADAHPITDRLGQSIKLTGHQLYASVNSQLINCGQSTVAVPPSDWSVFSLAGSSVAFSVATGCAITLPGVGASADFVLVAFSRPVPAGRSLVESVQSIGCAGRRRNERHDDHGRLWDCVWNSGCRSEGVHPADSGEPIRPDGCCVCDQLRGHVMTQPGGHGRAALSKRRRRELLDALGGSCAHCGSSTDLQADVIKPVRTGSPLHERARENSFLLGASSPGKPPAALPPLPRAKDCARSLQRRASISGYSQFLIFRDLTFKKHSY